MQRRMGSLAAFALAAMLSGCGGGGSAVAPSAGAAGSGSGAAATPASPTNAQPPGGTGSVILSLKVPARSPLAKTLSLKPGVKLFPIPVRGTSSVVRRPAYINSTTQSVRSTVTWSSGTFIGTLNSTGSCTGTPPTSCSVNVPIPLTVPSSVIVQLIGLYGQPIGQASLSQAQVASLLTGVTEGIANAPTTLTFQPIAASIAVSGSVTFQEGQSQNFSVQYELFDYDGNDLVGDADGVLDSDGNLLTSVTLTAQGGALFSENSSDYPSSVSVSSDLTTATIDISGTNPVSDITFNNNTYDGSNQPDIVPSVPGNYVYYLDPLSYSSGYNYYTYSDHGISGISPFNYIEYPTPADLPSDGDTFTVYEGVPSDYPVVSVTQDEYLINNLPMPNYGSNCAAVVSGISLSSPSFTVNYNSGSINGVCTMVVTDNYGNYGQLEIDVNNPTVVIQSKARRPAAVKGAK